MSRDGSVETWSRIVRSASELDNTQLHIIMSEFNAFPYCISNPESKRRYSRSPALLLCLGEGKVMILNMTWKLASSQVLPIDSVEAIEMGKALLTAWIRLYSPAGRVTIWFNSVSAPLYDPFLEAFRASKEKKSPPSNCIKVAPLEDMLLIDYKYYTFPHATLAERYLRARFYHPFFIVEPRFFRPQAIGSYFLVCSYGLIYLFSEEELIRYARAADYSMVITYIPLEGCGMLREEGEGRSYVWFSFLGNSQNLKRIPVANEYLAAFFEFLNNCGLKIQPA